VLGVDYAVYGESPIVTTSAILVGLLLSRSRAAMPTSSRPAESGAAAGAIPRA
jgi:hypothetical protein